MQSRSQPRQQPIPPPRQPSCPSSAASRALPSSDFVSPGTDQQHAAAASAEPAPVANSSCESAWAAASAEAAAVWEVYADAKQWPALPESGYQRSRSLFGGGGPDYRRLAECKHDEILWQRAFADAGDGTANPDMRQIRALRTLIWLQTQKMITGALKSNWPLPIHPDPAPFTEVCRGFPPGSLGEAVQAEVLQRDILEVACERSAAGQRVAVLNMACAGSPGGGFRDGAGAQEENLHRRTDLYRFTVEQARRNYPIPEDACLLSKDVTILRDTERAGYPFLRPEHMSRVCVISCAAVQHPRLTRSLDYQSSRDGELMQRKAAVILGAAARAECDVVILSAFGCGAFGNPPKAVAQMFRNALEQSPIRSVVFCIFDDHNAGREHNPQGNVRPFKEVFGIQ